MKRSISILALVFLAGATLPAAADVIRQSSEKSASAAGVRLVRLENSRGSIDVRPSTDGMIHLVALKEVRASSTSDRHRISDDTQVLTSTEGGAFLVRVMYPNSTSVRLSFWDLFQGFEMPRCEVHLTLEMPASVTLELHSSSGDLSTTGLAGVQQFETSSGDVRIRDAAGAVDVMASSGDITAVGLNRARLRTSSGDVQVDGVRGPIDVRTRSGDVTLHGARDSVAASTGSGDIEVDHAPRGIHTESGSGRIEVRDAAGAVQCSSESGNVEADVRVPLARVDIDSGSGDVDLSIDRAAGLRLDLRTTSGTVEADLPIRVTEASRHALRGVVGNGQAPVTLRSSSGDIHVRSGGR